MGVLVTVRVAAKVGVTVRVAPRVGVTVRVGVTMEDGGMAVGAGATWTTVVGIAVGVAGTASLAPHAVVSAIVKPITLKIKLNLIQFISFSLL